MTADYSKIHKMPTTPLSPELLAAAARGEPIPGLRRAHLVLKRYCWNTSGEWSSECFTELTHYLARNFTEPFIHCSIRGGLTPLQVFDLPRSWDPHLFNERNPGRSFYKFYDREEMWDVPVIRSIPGSIIWESPPCHSHHENRTIN